MVSGGEGADPGEVIEPDDRWWRWTKAVFEFGENFIDFGESGDIAESVIEFHAKRNFRNVIVGEASVEGEFHFRFMSLQ